MTEEPKTATPDTTAPELKLENDAAGVKAKVPKTVDIVFSRDGVEVSRIKTGNNALVMYTELTEELPDELKSCDVEIVSKYVRDGCLRGSVEAVAKALADDILPPDSLGREIQGFTETLLYRTPALVVSIIVHFGEQNPSPIHSRMSGSVPVSVDDCRGNVKAIDVLRQDFVDRLRKSGIEVDDDKNLIVPATTLPTL